MVWLRYGWASYYGIPKSMQSCGSCHSLILRCVLIEKVTQLPVIYRGHGIEKERQLSLNIAVVNVVIERAEHRKFHIMLDTFSIFTMTIGGFSFIYIIVYTMVSIDMCKHKAGYRLYHKTNAIFADLESWGLYVPLHNDYFYPPLLKNMDKIARGYIRVRL